MLKSDELLAKLVGTLHDSMVVLQVRRLDMKWDDLATLRTDEELQRAIVYCDNPQRAPFDANAFRIVSHRLNGGVLYGTGA